MSRSAVAQPSAIGETHAEPPAPVAMPDLSLHSRVATKMSAGLLLDTPGALLGSALVLDGGYARGDVALFARAAIRANRIEKLDDENTRLDDRAFGNVAVGARYVATFGHVAVSPALWTWLPTASSSSSAWRSEAKLGALADARAFDGGAAIGVAFDAAWRTPCGFVQIEGGAVLVPGVEVDNVFAAIGAGQRVATNLSLVAEVRAERFPARDTTDTLATLGVGVRGGTTVHWQLRAHPMVYGLAIGADLEWRFD